MNKIHHQFNAPFFDKYQIGFALPNEHKPNWRQRTIAGVSLNAEEQEAYFFNPDGLVLPLKHHPYELPLLLRKHHPRIELATIQGTGLFAIKPAQLNAMPQSVRSRWVTYWLIDGSEQYANTKEVWEAYMAKEVELRLRSHTPQMTDTQDIYWPPHLRRQNATEQDLETLTERRQAYFKRSLIEAEKDCHAEWSIRYAKECAKDQQINAWLRGVLGQPPLLAAMQGAA